MIYLNDRTNNLSFKGFDRVIHNPEAVSEIMEKFSDEEKFAFNEILGQLEEDVYQSSIKGNVKLTIAPYNNNTNVSALATYEPPEGSNNLHRISGNFFTNPEQAFDYKMNPEKIDKSSRSIPTVELFMDKIKNILA